MINIEYRSFAGGSPGQKLGRGHEAKGEGNWKVEQREKLILVLIHSVVSKTFTHTNKYETRNMQHLVEYYTISPH